MSKGLAGMPEQADGSVSKTDDYISCGFDSHYLHLTWKITMVISRTPCNEYWWKLHRKVMAYLVIGKGEPCSNPGIRV